MHRGLQEHEGAPLGAEFCSHLDLREALITGECWPHL